MTRDHLAISSRTPAHARLAPPPARGTYGSEGDSRGCRGAQETRRLHAARSGLPGEDDLRRGQTPRYSALSPAALTTLPVLMMSCCTNLRNSSGVLVTTSAPCNAYWSLASWVCMTLIRFSRSLVRIALGVP